MKDLAALTELEPATEHYLAACWSDSTRRCYTGDLRDYLRWGGAFPATPELIVAYVSDRAKTLKVQTLARRLTGIGMAHAIQGYPDPTKAVVIKKLLRGIKRVHGVAQRQAGMEDAGHPHRAGGGALVGRGVPATAQQVAVRTQHAVVFGS